MLRGAQGLRSETHFFCRYPMRVLLLTALLVSACGVESQSHDLHGGSNALKVTISEGPKPSNGRGSGPMVVHVDTTQAAFAAQTNIKKFMKRSASGTVEATKLFAPYAETMAYKLSKESGPNCWHASIAAIFPSWQDTKRFVSEKEFACHLKHSFKETKAPTFGDVIRFRKDSGEEVHGATYIGVDADGKDIAFSKNGYDKERGYFFYTLETAKRVYSGGDVITYWTPVKEPKDPTKEGMECYEEALYSHQEDKAMRGWVHPSLPIDF